MPHSTLQHLATGPRKTAEERSQARQQLRALYALPIYQLPAEIMLNILNRLELNDFPSLVPATWHLLRHHGIAPSILTPRLTSILEEARPGLFSSVENATDCSSNEYLPLDLRRLVISHLAPRDQFFRSFTNIGLRFGGGFELLPMELRDNIFSHFDPTTNINVALACFRFSNRDIKWLTHEEVCRVRHNRE